jgi:hypothetical protein
MGRPLEMRNFEGNFGKEQRLMRFPNAESQVLPYEAEACESPEAKQTYSSMDPIENW